MKTSRSDQVKEVYLLRGRDHEEYQAFVQTIMEAVEALGRQLKPAALRLTVTAQPPPRLSFIPFSRKKLAAISIHRTDSCPIDSLLSMKELYGAYRVDEAIPRAYVKTWNDKEPTPGTCLLTLFSKRPDIEYETFIDRWHNGHTPLSLRIHPLWNYVRNVVTGRLCNNAAAFDGIVEENFRTASDLLNPFRFFGHPGITLYRMLQVYLDSKSFIDYAKMETYLTTEYHWIN